MAKEHKRFCSGCGVRLDSSNWTPGRKRAGHYICRSCTAKRQQAYKNRVGHDVVRTRANAAARKRRQLDPEKHRLAKWENRLKNDYGLTLDEYAELLVRQAGGCAICKETLTSERQVHTDHCHHTGKVRGILCQKCNIGLGHFRDDTKLLRAAIAYLIDPPAC